MKQMTFRLSAYCDAAGKNSGKNEDNYLVDDSLSGTSLGNFVTDKETELSEKGVLMVVADGMGGMKAGEIASSIVIETVKEHFLPDLLTESILATETSRRKYLEKVIIAADSRIKAAGKDNAECEGMGSTIVMGWLVGESITVAWVGDSRAYRYSSISGLEQLSHDHSYVQELVDKGLLLPEYAFDHPDGNIITRSLGDFNKKVKPDSVSWKVNEKDILLLCSDGLCGVVRDEEIEEIISQNSASMLQCQQALWEAAENAGWYDNMTTILCEILSIPTEETSDEKDGKITKVQSTCDGTPLHSGKGKNRKVIWVILILLIVLVAIGIAYIYWEPLVENIGKFLQEAPAANGTEVTNDSVSTKI